MVVIHSLVFLGNPREGAPEAQGLKRGKRERTKGKQGQLGYHLIPKAVSHCMCQGPGLASIPATPMACMRQKQSPICHKAEKEQCGEHMLAHF